jgi:MOSC domain-containing protein YiiM
VAEPGGAEARLEAIWIAGVAAARPARVPRARALVGHGLEGDRYAAGAGTFSGSVRASTRDLSLIDADDVEAALAELGDDLVAGDLRRNLVLRGLPLRELIGARLRLGEVLIEVTGTCPPCGHLDRLLGREAQAVLAERGGMRAGVLQGGWLEEGASVVLERPPRRLP